VEALLRVLMLKANAESFAKVVAAVLYVRPARRLCETCRQPYQPAPQMLQKLGLPPGRVNVLYRQWQPPPPEQLVDEKGNPIPPPICPSCGGLGYKGRFGIFELLMINDQMRQALVKQPKLEVLRKVAAAAKHRTIKDEGIACVARGISSLNEVQRVLQK
jgi:type II secretory ATPase GspE/PulE/Tfp pilus assembly ATPase PilB-like protein